MANTYFQFKQFTVHQEHTAMKVCTDACLFGAWVAKDLSLNNVNSILDIGTGTGLLSLMLAQITSENKILAKITAIEIEAAAAKEASSNFKASPWNDNIHLVQSAIQDYENSNPFDCVISNPPFFEGDLQSPDLNKNLASHSTALPWSDLIKDINRFLKQDGVFYVIIPALRAYTMQKLATQIGIQLDEEVVVFNAEKQKPFRVFQKYIKTNTQVTEIKRSNFIIKNSDNSYTNAFTELLKDYYLHL